MPNLLLTDIRQDSTGRLERLNKTRSFPAAEFWVSAAYLLVVGGTQLHHEPWADEAQAWLLGRDASLWQLWGSLLRLEGSPGLWHSLLHVLARLGAPYAGLAALSLFLGAAGCFILVRYAPFPLAIRILLPFTYFLCYQYAVVARSYSLVAVLLFGIAAAYGKPARPWWILSVLLSLLAMVSAQAFVLSSTISFVLVLEELRRPSGNKRRGDRTTIGPAILYAAVLILVSCAVWPSPETSFAVARDWSWAHFVGLSRYSFMQALGRGYWPLILLGLSLPLLSAGPGLSFLIVASGLLCVFGSVVYSNLWHDGFFVLAWLFALWLSGSSRKLGAAAILALLAFLVIQCSWTWKAVRYDWDHSYSGSLAMARYIKEHGIERSGMMGIGYPIVAVQPYFAANIFRNFVDGQHERAYWLWSRATNSNDAAEHLGSTQPAFVLFGYSSDADKRLWGSLITQSGYQMAAHFEGNLFWRTNPLQAENYVLFQRGGQTADSHLQSELDLSSGAADDQLTFGVSELYKDRGRWTNGTFAASLQRPRSQPGASVARLQLDFVLRPEEIETFGPLVLTAYIAGRRLPSETYTQEGAYHYASTVRDDDLRWEVVPVAFKFEKSGRMTSGVEDRRIAVVSRIGLLTK